MNIPDNVKHNRVTPIVSLRKYIRDFAEAVENLFSNTYSKSEVNSQMAQKLDIITQEQFNAIFN